MKSKKIYKKLINIICGLAIFFPVLSCSKTIEMDIEEIEELQNSLDYDLLQKSLSRPYLNQPFKSGKKGGIWYDTILSDPKTFNQLVASRDGSSYAIISNTTTGLFDYDPITKKWLPYAASFKIELNPDTGLLILHCKIRDDIYWTWPDSDKKVPLTSDDFIFWYNEIQGDEEAGLGGYESQCLLMPDGSLAHVDCVKIDDKNFDFVYPRPVAEPVLHSNMSCCPSFIFRPAKEKGGLEGVKNLFGIDCDPKTIPSCGKFYITEYIPSRRLVFTRNPDYWEKDSNGVSTPYYEQMICQIVGDQNTNYLLFRQGKTETCKPRPEELSDVVNNQKSDYTVYNAEGSMTSQFWTFNQNPANKSAPYYSWFTKKEFRQAMSCILNRQRIINQTYRGLAEPHYFFFPPINPFYNENIQLEYRYNLQRAKKILSSAGFNWNENDILIDEKGNAVEFDLAISSGVTVTNDIAQIISDEASKIGIKINVRQTDFQKLIESLTVTFDWQSVIIGLGIIAFPTQGSNVWPSNGNMHLWYPLQKTPVTEWEARVDYLYKEGGCTLDSIAAKKIWDEYQSIFLEECPLIYLVRPRSFFAIRNKWNLDNVYYDNLNGIMGDWVYLAE